jgi:hypothetical protein
LTTHSGAGTTSIRGAYGRCIIAVAGAALSAVEPAAGQSAQTKMLKAAFGSDTLAFGAEAAAVDRRLARWRKGVVNKRHPFGCYIMKFAKILFCIFY